MDHGHTPRFWHQMPFLAEDALQAMVPMPTPPHRLPDGRASGQKIAIFAIHGEQSERSHRNCLYKQVYFLKRGYIDNTKVGYADFRNNNKRQKRMLHIGVVESTTTIDHRGNHFGRFLRHYFRALVRHENGSAKVGHGSGVIISLRAA